MQQSTTSNTPNSGVPLPTINPAINREGFANPTAARNPNNMQSKTNEILAKMVDRLQNITSVSQNVQQGVYGAFGNNVVTRGAVQMGGMVSDAFDTLLGIKDDEDADPHLRVEKEQERLLRENNKFLEDIVESTRTTTDILLDIKDKLDDLQIPKPSERVVDAETITPIDVTEIIDPVPKSTPMKIGTGPKETVDVDAFEIFDKEEPKTKDSQPKLKHDKGTIDVAATIVKESNEDQKLGKMLLLTMQQVNKGVAALNTKPISDQEDKLESKNRNSVEEISDAIIKKEVSSSTVAAAPETKDLPESDTIGNVVAGAAGAGIAKTAGSVLTKGASVLGKVGKLATKAVPGIGLAIAAGEAVYGAYDGAKNASEILGLDREATLGERVAAGAGGALDAVTFGLIDKNKTARFLAPKSDPESDKIAAISDESLMRENPKAFKEMASYRQQLIDDAMKNSPDVNMKEIQQIKNDAKVAALDKFGSEFPKSLGSAVSVVAPSVDRYDVTDAPMNSLIESMKMDESKTSGRSLNPDMETATPVRTMKPNMVKKEESITDAIQPLATIQAPAPSSNNIVNSNVSNQTTVLPSRKAVSNTDQSFLRYMNSSFS